MKNYFRKLLAFLSILVMVFMVGKIEVNARPDFEYTNAIADISQLTPQVSLNIGYIINDLEFDSSQEAYSITKNNNKNNLSMQVVVNFNSSIYNTLYKNIIANSGNTDSIPRFGYIYCLTSDLPIGETITSILFDDSKFVEQDCKDLKTNVTIETYSYLHNNCFVFADVAKVKSDSFTTVTAEYLQDGQFAQYGFSLSNISLSKIDTEISVVFYFYFGRYAVTNERIISVKSIADTYVKADDTSSYTDHLGVLSWLANKNSN